MDDETAAPVVKEVLAIRLGAQESSPLELLRFPREASLRRGDVDAPASEIARVDPREAMDRVAFGHRLCPGGRALLVRGNRVARASDASRPPVPVAGQSQQSG